MVLRVLIILFLVLAFARPTLKGVAIGGATSAAKTTAVFILDNTPSMSVIDSKGSYLNQAKATIKQILGLMQNGDEVALVLTGDPYNNDIKVTSNLSKFQKQVDAVNISDVSGLLNSAIVKAAKILSKTNNFNKEIYVLTDFQMGRLADKNSISDLGQILNDKVRLYTFDYSRKEVSNAGIDDISLNTQIFEQDKPLDFNVTVTNYSNQRLNNLVVSLFVENVRSAQQSVSLNPGESRILTLQAPVKQSGFIGAYAEIEDDDILEDDRRYISIYIPKSIPVVIFTDNADDSRFVNLALSAAGSGQTLQVNEKNLNELNSANLSKYDVAVIIGSEGISRYDLLSSFLKSGGKIILMPGSKSTLQNFDNITKALGIPSPTGTAGKEGSDINSFTFEKEDFSNPIFKDIFSSKEKKEIESPAIYYHYKLSTEGKGENIITLNDGSSFLSEYKINKGKLLLFNTAPILTWTNFPIKNLFAPLITKSVLYMSSKDNSSNQIIAGNPVEINLQNNSSPQLKIEAPSNRTGNSNNYDDYVDIGKQLNRNFVTYNHTDINGNYKVYAGSNIIDEFSVNSDPAESVTKYYSQDKFADYLKKINFKGKYFNIDKKEDPVKIITQARFGSELWKYFLLGAILLALIEMAIARNTKRELI